MLYALTYIISKQEHNEKQKQIVDKKLFILIDSKHLVEFVNKKSRTIILSSNLFSEKICKRDCKLIVKVYNFFKLLINFYVLLYNIGILKLWKINLQNLKNLALFWCLF